MRRILVTIPTYNEAENITTMLDAVISVGEELSDYEMHVLVVDDSSPDGTGKIVRKLAKHNPRIHLLNGKKVGLGNAYLRGFKHGLKIVDPFAVIMMDADFSHNPTAIPRLLDALEQGADYAIGSRYVHGGTIPGNWPLRRILNSRVANSLARTLTGIPGAITDITGGYKAIRGTTLRQIDLGSINATGYVFQVSLLHTFLQHGAKVKEIPITFLDRRFGTSKMKFGDIAEFIYRTYRLNPDSQFHRLLKFITVGASGTVVNIVTLFGLVHFLHLPIILAAGAAIELSIISNFLLNDTFTFQTTDTSQGMPDGNFAERIGQGPEAGGSFARRFARFNLGAIVGAGIALAILTTLNTEFGVFYLLADLLAIVVATGWNFWISTKYVWVTSNA